MDTYENLQKIMTLVENTRHDKVLYQPPPEPKVEMETIFHKDKPFPTEREVSTIMKFVKEDKE